MHLAQRYNMLWFNLCQILLRCSPNTLEVRDFARCQWSVQVTVRVNIDGIDSSVHISCLVKNNHMVHFLVNSDTTETKTFRELQRKRSRRAFLSCSNFPVMLKSSTYAATKEYAGPRASVENHQTVGSVLVPRPPIDVKNQ